MAAEDRIRWDKTYRDKAEEPYPPPDPLLFEYTPPITDPSHKYRALDLAGGFGQNGLWLAAQGYTVDVMDISRVALMRAQEEMGKRELRNVNLLPADLDDPDFNLEYYDILCVFRFLHRDLFPRLRQTVKPGGRVIYETFNVRHLENAPNFNRAYLLEIGELAGYFADWKLLHNADGKGMSRVVAVKPEQT